MLLTCIKQLQLGGKVQLQHYFGLSTQVCCQGNFVHKIHYCYVATYRVASYLQYVLQLHSLCLTSKLSATTVAILSLIQLCPSAEQFCCIHFFTCLSDICHIHMLNITARSIGQLNSPSLISIHFI